MADSTGMEMTDATGMELTSSTLEQEVGSGETPMNFLDRTGDGVAVPGIVYAWQVLLTSLPLFLADMLGLAALLSIAEFLDAALLGRAADTMTVIPQIALALFLSHTAFGLYPGVGMNCITEIRRTAFSLTVVFGTISAVLLASLPDAARVAPLVVTYVSLLLLAPMLRQFSRSVAARYCWWGQRAIILGGGPAGVAAFQALLAHPRYGLRPVGILDDDLSDQWQEESVVKPEWYLGPISNAAEVCAEHRVVWGLLAITPKAGETARVMDHFASIVTHLLVPANCGRKCDGGYMYGQLHLVRVDERLLLPGAQLLKRMLDLLITIVGGVVVLPLSGVLAVLIKLTSSGPIFYSQMRIGYRGQAFRVWKFRTMVEDADRILHEYLSENTAMREEYSRTFKLRNDPRITMIGRFLRKTSFDELPQLWNVFKGEMSLVGPRPMLTSEIATYATFHDDFVLYMRVVPGITGLWQVSGRTSTSYERRIELNSHYVRNWSLWLDAYIFVRTIRVVLFREGAS